MNIIIRIISSLCLLLIFCDVVLQASQNSARKLSSGRSSARLQNKTDENEPIQQFGFKTPTIVEGTHATSLIIKCFNADLINFLRYATWANANNDNSVFTTKYPVVLHQQFTNLETGKLFPGISTTKTEMYPIKAILEGMTRNRIEPIINSQVDRYGTGLAQLYIKYNSEKKDPERTPFRDHLCTFLHDMPLLLQDIKKASHIFEHEKGFFKQLSTIYPFPVEEYAHTELIRKLINEFLNIRVQIFCLKSSQRTDQLRTLIAATRVLNTAEKKLKKREVTLNLPTQHLKNVPFSEFYFKTPLIVDDDDPVTQLIMRCFNSDRDDFSKLACNVGAIQDNHKYTDQSSVTFSEQRTELGTGKEIEERRQRTVQLSPLMAIVEGMVKRRISDIIKKRTDLYNEEKVTFEKSEKKQLKKNKNQDSEKQFTFLDHLYAFFCDIPLILEYVENLSTFVKAEEKFLKHVATVYEGPIKEFVHMEFVKKLINELMDIRISILYAKKFREIEPLFKLIEAAKILDENEKVQKVTIKD